MIQNATSQAYCCKNECGIDIAFETCTAKGKDVLLRNVRRPFQNIKCKSDIN